MNSSNYIRGVRSEDRARWMELFKGCIEFYKSEESEEVIETTWKHLLAVTVNSRDFISV
jgi:hypothetical protein